MTSLRARALGAGEGGMGRRRGALRNLNVRVRNVATVGGAPAHADPHMDPLPLDGARCPGHDIGTQGERSVPVEAPTRAIWRTRWRGTSSSRESLFLPWGTSRRVSQTPRVWRTTGRGRHRRADRRRGRAHRVGAAIDRPTRLASAERFWGRAGDPRAPKEAAEAAAEEAKIEGDLHGSAAYKKQLVRVYLQRTLHEARRAIH
jgi:carbon-monoxide dehydrogenase medium subunit